MVKTDLFSVIQFPFNFTEMAAADELHPLARERGLGLLAMKPFGGGLLDNAGLAFKFLRQFPDVVPLPGCDTVASVDEVTAIYQHGKCGDPGRSGGHGALPHRIGG